MQTAAISPDGTTVVTDRLDPRTSTSDLWLHDAIHNTDSRFTFDPATDEGPVWSPDGSRVAFNSTRDGKPGIWIRPAAGIGKEELLLEWPNPVFVSDWSRDGRFLVFTSVLTQTRPDIFIMSDPLDPAKRKTGPYLQTPASEHDARLSPDGRWMAYSSDESRDFQIYVSSFPGKESKFQISSDGGIHPFWSRDGKELFYLTPERVLMGVQLSGGPRFDHAAPRVLFQTRVITSSVPGISPDGKRFLMPSLLSATGDTPIHVITNWHARVAVR
jgi:Tol biopolymer transport system component